MIRALEAEGWREVRSKGSHRQFKHHTKPGLVTVAIHGSRDLKAQELASIERQSGLKLRRQELDTEFYRALIVQDEGDKPHDGYGVVFPDLPGCTSSGETVEKAYENAFEALALHVEGMIEEGASLPAPSPFNAPLPRWLARISGKIERTVLVPVKIPGRAIRISITMDKGLLARLDAVAATSGETRSGYIAQAVRERMEREHRRANTSVSASEPTARRA